MYILGFLFGLVNGSTRFVWGILMDKFGFKKINIAISCLEIITCSTIYFCSKIPFLFVFENLLVACCIGGTFTTITPLFNVIFGKELGIEIYGLTGFAIGFATLLGPILAKFMIKKIDDYLLLYLIGGGICVIKFIALICFNEKEPYIFKEENESHKNEPFNNSNIETNKLINDNEED